MIAGRYPTANVVSWPAQQGFKPKSTQGSIVRAASRWLKIIFKISQIQYGNQLAHRKIFFK